MEKRACNSKDAEVRKGPWTMEEDLILINYIANHGDGVWNSLARSAGLKRTGKSCRLRWLNYLRPDVRRGNITPEEQLLIMELHAKWGNRWSKIAKHLPGRTDNEIKNHWRTRIQKHIKQAESSSAGQSSEHNYEHQASTSQMSGAVDHHAVETYSVPGNLEAFPLPGRTENDFKNYWRTRIQKHVKEAETFGAGLSSDQSADQHAFETYSPPSSYPGNLENFSAPFPTDQSNDNMWIMEDLWSMQLLNGD